MTASCFLTIGVLLIDDDDDSNCYDNKAKKANIKKANVKKATKAKKANLLAMFNVTRRNLL